MKKRISSLLIALAMLLATLLAITACGGTSGENAPCVTCEDKNSDHKCDVCDKVLTECKDASGDHKCDACAKVLTECSDANADHKCDVCDKVLTECKDTDGDKKCDACNKTLSGGESVEPHTCADGNKDHFCDTCAAVLTECSDANTDHKCDTCTKRMGCYNENGDHKCDKCHAVITPCKDNDKDHECDVCGLWHSDCYDPERDGTCNICGKPFTHVSSYIAPTVGGPDGSALDPNAELTYLGASLSDEGEFDSTLYLIHGKPYYTFYHAFTQQPLGAVAYHFGTSDGYHGDYITGEGYVRDGKYIIPMTYVPKEGQLPGCINPRFVYTYEEDGQLWSCLPGFSIELVPDNDRPIFLGVSPDGNVANVQDSFLIGTCEAKRYMYFHFSAPITVSTIQGASFAVEDAYMENGIFTVRARMYAANVGTHKISITVFVGTKDALYPLHMSAYNNVAILDVYRKSSNCTCTDANGDHACDLCGSITACEDSVQDTDHNCDICGKLLGGHVDYDGRGLRDGICDICGAPYAPTIPGGGSTTHTCTDTNKDHICDDQGCRKSVGTHAAAAGSHICDYCEKTVSSCYDANKDDFCDVCRNPMKNDPFMEEPFFYGYSSNPYETTPGMGELIALTYGREERIYLFFNTEVEITGLSFFARECYPSLVETNERGAVYEVIIPAPDIIFGAMTAEFYFHTPYSTEGYGSIVYNCLPETLPTLLGVIDNDTLIPEGTATVWAGDNLTIRFALNAEVQITKIIIQSNMLDMFAVDCIYMPTEDYYLYTLRVADSDLFFEGNLDLQIHYNYLGASASEDYSSLLPILTPSCEKANYHVLGAEIDGFDLSNGTVMIPKAEFHTVTIYLNGYPTYASLSCNGESTMATIGEMTDRGVPITFTFPSPVNAEIAFHVEVYNGDMRPMLIGAYHVTLMAEPLPEILSISNNETGKAMEDGIIYVSPNGKVYLQVTYSAPIDGSYLYCNGQRFDAYAHESLPNTYIYYGISDPQYDRSESSDYFSISAELYAYHNGEEKMLTWVDCRQEFVKFFGVYLSTADYTPGNKQTGVTVPAGQSTTVYVACNTDLCPSYAALQEEAINEYGNDCYDEANNVFFFMINIPSELLNTPNSSKKLELHLGESYMGIVVIYVVNIA